MTIASLIAVAALMTIQTPPPVPASPPAIVVEGGKIAGWMQGDVRAFRDIPYAAPPVGALRWRAPQPLRGWTGVRDGTRPGAICIQPPANGDPGVGPLPMSEDCLTLNVWTPDRPEGPLPVMVWVHGGGFNNGSGTAALYDGAALARRGVVVVTVNYRLGRLGFFDHPALASERPPDEAGGNYGMMDIVAALTWVRDNAAAFGGDAGNVTVFGESAGGAAVTRLMISPEARGLFHRAVVQSGLGRETGTPLDRPSVIGGSSLQDRGVAWARAAGLGEATAEALRAVPAERLLSPAPNFFGGDNLVIDGRVVTEDVEASFAAGRQAPVPLVIGTNSAEFWWIRPTEISPYGGMDDAMTSEERVAMRAAYGGAAGYDAHVVSDLAFNEPARHLARLHARAGHPTYLYRFDVVPLSNPEPSGGATHASERPYVFDTLDTVGRPMGERDRAAATVMADYWTGFARAGDPNGQGRPAWPEFGREADRLLEFTNDGPVAKAVPFKERLDLIERYWERVR